MSSDVERHYETLLAEHYTWMFGVSFDEKAAEQRLLLENLGFGEGPRGPAVDLGCGPGFQAVALADLGFTPVLAVDTSEALLDELRHHASGWSVEPVHADIRRLMELVSPESMAAVICMGDTLPHLATGQDVRALFHDAHSALRPEGRIALTFRDLSQPLSGIDRFIPIRADQDRIMMCALDYEPEHVAVTDLVHVRQGGLWSLHKSSYRKLRLSPADVCVWLHDAGLTVVRSEPVGRMHAIVARK
jgi:SAM-dependent methyltransferase